MKTTKYSHRAGLGLPVFMVLLLVSILACRRLPSPDFTFTPTDNPESGDTIRFLNISVDADSYVWEFGDNNSSTEENPEHIYSDPGVFLVKLTATNSSGNESETKSLLINEPTILGFAIVDSTEDRNPLPGAELWLYDNDTDFMLENEPLAIRYADNDGLIYFENMEAVVYYILVSKLETGGGWFFAGSTPVALTLNVPNLYYVPCYWIDDEKKGAPEEKVMKKVLSWED
jgi:PKD repeat protein